MNWRRSSLCIATSLLAFGAGLSAWHWTHGHCADVTGGFFIGVSIATMILGLARPSRRLSR